MTDYTPTHLWTPAGPARLLPAKPDPIVGPQPMTRDSVTTPTPARSTCADCGVAVHYDQGYDQPWCFGCSPCDECDHTMRQHYSLHDQEAAGQPVDWDTATCWGSSVCASCAGR